MNKYFHLGIEKPKGDILVSYDGGITFDNTVDWMERRTCMMAGIAGGNGYFGEGWGSTGTNGCDRGLICDPPDYWINVEDYDKFLKDQNAI